MTEELIEQSEEQLNTDTRTEEEIRQDEYDKVFFDKEVEETEEVEVEEPTKEVEEPTKEVEEEPEAPKGKVLKWQGKEVEVSDEELMAMAQQGFDYTYKTQQLSKERKRYQALDEKNISDDDIDLIIRAKSGDMEALATLAKSANIDPLDLVDVEVREQPKTEDSFVSPQVKEIITVIQKDQELFTKMQSIENSLPSSVIDTMAKDANLMYAIVNEVKSGDADIVLPNLYKKMATFSDIDRMMVENDPNQFANLYASVKQDMMRKPKEEVKAVETKPNIAEVAIKTSQENRSKEVDSNAFTNDKTYEAILARLNRQ